MKRVLKYAALLTLAVAAYLGAAAWYVWKWSTPHHDLPPGHLQPQTAEVHDPQQRELADQVQAELLSLAEELQLVSLSAAMAIDGQPVWAGVTGLADVEKQQPATLHSRYRIGSVSKALTAVALARMVEREQLALDDEVQRYLPDWPRVALPMTLRQLASHSAGIRHYGYDLSLFPPHDSFLNAHFDDVIAATSVFRDDALLFSPGQGFGYSTYGYTLLSAAMQQAAAKPYLQLMDEYLFDPIGMHHTSAESDADRQHLVRFYNAEAGRYGATRDVDLSVKWAGGGLVSTPTDLVKLGAALLADQLIRPQTRTEFFTPQRLPDGQENPQAYAIGWRHHETVNILGEEQPVRVVHHGGTSEGGAAFLLLVPDHHIVVAALTNSMGKQTRVELQRFAYRIAALAIKHRDADSKR